MVYRFFKKSAKNMPIGTWAMQQAGQTASSAIDAGLGMVIGGFNDRRQLKQQEKLQRLQIAGQKEMSDYQFRKQLEMWEATGYGAQKRQLKEAGMNVGLMYGMGGGGGQTTGSASGNVTGGTAPSDGREAMTAMGMGMQMELLKAQKDLLVSQAEKNRAETTKTAGVDTTEGQTRIQMLEQGIDNARQKYEIGKLEMTLKNIENFEKQATQENRLDYIEYQTRMAMKQLEMVENEAYISSGTINDKIKIIQQEAIGAAIKNELTKAQVTATTEQINKMAQDILQGWRTIDINERKLALDKFSKELEANFPGISQTMGRVLNDAVESIFKLTEQTRGKHYKQK